MTDNHSVSSANALLAPRSSNVSNRSSKKSNKSEHLNPQPNQNPETPVSDKASSKHSNHEQSIRDSEGTPILQSKEVLYQQMEYYESGDLVFLQRDDFLWPGKVVKPNKDYRSYRVKPFQGKKIETKTFSELMDFNAENKEKCIELFQKRERDVTLERTLTKALAAAETAQKEMKIEEDKARQKELKKIHKKIEQESYAEILQQQKEKNPFDAGVEEEYNKNKKKKSKNYEKIIEFAQKKTQYEKNIEEIAKQKVAALTSHAQQGLQEPKSHQIQDIQSPQNEENHSNHNQDNHSKHSVPEQQALADVPQTPIRTIPINPPQTSDRHQQIEIQIQAKDELGRSIPIDNNQPQSEKMLDEQNEHIAGSVPRQMIQAVDRSFIQQVEQLESPVHSNNQPHLEEQKAQQMPPFKAYYPVNFEEDTDKQLTSSNRKLKTSNIEQSEQNSEVIAITDRIQSLGYAIQGEFNKIHSLSQENLVKLCEHSLDRINKALTEPHSSHPINFLLLLQTILNANLISLQRINTSKIIARMALFIGIYQNIVEDSTLVSEYHYFRWFCKKTVQQCKEKGIGIDRRVSDLLGKTGLLD